MIYEELYLNLNYNQKLTLTIAIVAIFILVQIIARIKNNQQKGKNKQVTCQRPKKVFNARNFISNYDEFIAENTKGMTLFEIKEFIRSLDLEIYSLVMKGVR